MGSFREVGVRVGVKKKYPRFTFDVVGVFWGGWGILGRLGSELGSSKSTLDLFLMRLGSFREVGVCIKQSFDEVGVL